MAGKATEQRYAVRWSLGFEYGYDSRVLDWGQVFTLQGTPGDERLERLGYIVPLDKGVPTVTCGECGAEFTGDTQRTAHGRKRHAFAALDPEAEDAAADRAERQAVTMTPLLVENSAAARA